MEGKCAHTEDPLCHRQQLLFLWCQGTGMCMNTWKDNKDPLETLTICDFTTTDPT